MNDNIHDYHGTLPPEQAAELNDAAASQEKRVLEILSEKKSKHFAYFEIIAITGFDKDSAKRALSNLSGSASHDRYKDQYDNWPVVYCKDHRKKNPTSGKTCGTYKVNPVYGKRRAEPAEVHPAGQGDIFGAPASRHQGPYSGVGA